MRTRNQVAAQDAVIHQIEERLPDFVKACRDRSADTIVMHQAAFAADYQIDEMLLLGMAIKYAGLHGKNVTIIERA
jgi:hypothetical protein